MNAKKVFKAVFLFFVIIMIAIGVHMCSKTTSPWSKKKFENKYKVK